MSPKKAGISQPALPTSYLIRSGTTLIRLGATAVSGRLPAEVIRKVVREKFEYRKCYEEALARNSQLRGRVDVRFVIGRDGKVTNAAFAESSTVPDRADEAPSAELRLKTPEEFCWAPIAPVQSRA